MKKNYLEEARRATRRRSPFISSADAAKWDDESREQLHKAKAVIFTISAGAIVLLVNKFVGNTEDYIKLGYLKWALLLFTVAVLLRIYDMFIWAALHFIIKAKRFRGPSQFRWIWLPTVIMLLSFIAGIVLLSLFMLNNIDPPVKADGTII